MWMLVLDFESDEDQHEHVLGIAANLLTFCLLLVMVVTATHMLAALLGNPSQNWLLVLFQQ